MRALERDPERRYPTARDLQRDLEVFARAHGAHVSSGALAEWMERDVRSQARALAHAAAAPGRRPKEPRWRRGSRPAATRRAS